MQGMRRALRITVGVFGMIAGFSGIQHGFYEMLQGHVRPNSLFIVSYGPPCQPEQMWHGCEPAMTVIPDLFWSGICSMVAGLAVLIWAAAFVQRKHGGLVLVLLTVLQLLVGGGLVPPVIGIVAGLAGTRINSEPQRGRTGRGSQLLAMLWPWLLGFFVVWIFGQYPIGYYFNDWLRTNGHLIFLFIGLPMVLAIPAASARDARTQSRRIAA